MSNHGIDATNRKPFASHLTFDQQVEAGMDAYPCVCWQAGYGDIKGLRKDEVDHPDEFGKGWLAAFEREMDI